MRPQLLPRTYPIANGLAFGITAYALLKLGRGRITRTDWLLLTLFADLLPFFRVVMTYPSFHSGQLPRRESL